MKTNWGSKKTEKIIAKVVDPKSAKKTVLPSNELLAVNEGDTRKVKGVDGNPTA